MLKNLTITIRPDLFYLFQYNVDIVHTSGDDKVAGFDDVTSVLILVLSQLKFARILSYALIITKTMIVDKFSAISMKNEGFRKI